MSTVVKFHRQGAKLMIQEIFFLMKHEKNEMKEGKKIK